MRKLWGRGMWAAAMALGFASHGQAQEAPQCAVVAPPPAGFARWAHTVPAPAASTLAQAGRIVLPVGTARTLALPAGSAVRYAASPGRADTAASKGGMAAFDIARAGTYRIALSAKAWIEVVRGGQTIASTVHSHGPDCSGIRKIVDFPLKPGRYILQLNASEAAQVTVMIVAAPPRQ